MDEKKGPEKMPARESAPATAKERVGEILRNERERRNISILVIAKDLRLNPKFIEALEADDYNLLPGDTYIRVYLRSLSRYFSLNADELLEKFFNERGLSGVDTLRKDSSTKINIAALREKERPNKTAILAASVFIVLALLCYVAARQGWFSSETTPPVSTSADSTSLQTRHEDSTIGPVAKNPDTLEGDSLPGDGSDFNYTGLTNEAKAARDSLLSARTKKRSAKDSLLDEKARRKAINDSILAKKAVKDSILASEKRSRELKDSALKAEAKSRLIKDSIQRAEVRNRAVKDSMQRVEARSRAVKDSILKAEAKSKAAKDSVVKVEIANNKIKDSLLKVEARNKAVKDSLLSADAKSKIALEEIQKAQAKGRAVKDSILKAEAKSKAIRDSILKAEAKKKALKDSILRTELKAKNSGKDSAKTNTDPAGVKTALGSGQAMELKLSVTGTSAWVRVLCDGTPWRNILRKGAVKTFTAKDSFNLRTGMLEDVTWTLNGGKLDVPSKGIVALKIDHSGITVLTDDQWFKLTKGRF